LKYSSRYPEIMYEKRLWLCFFFFFFGLWILSPAYLALCVLIRRSGDAWCLVLPRPGCYRPLVLLVRRRPLHPLQFVVCAWFVVVCTARQRHSCCHSRGRLESDDDYGIAVRDGAVVGVPLTPVSLVAVASWRTWDDGTGTWATSGREVAKRSRHPSFAPPPRRILPRSVLPSDWMTATVDIQGGPAGAQVSVAAEAAVVVVVVANEKSIAVEISWLIDVVEQMLLHGRVGGKTAGRSLRGYLRESAASLQKAIPGPSPVAEPSRPRSRRIPPSPTNEWTCFGSKPTPETYDSQRYLGYYPLDPVVPFQWSPISNLPPPPRPFSSPFRALLDSEWNDWCPWAASRLLHFVWW